jgi:GntR family transcriptional regulator, arabinose operon transcriptional repressor
MASKTGSLPLYQQIYDKLIEDVQAKRLNPGDRVPSENELSRRFGVSRITTKRVLEMLSDEGLVERVPGKGTFLKELSSVYDSGGPSDSPCGRLIGLVMTQFADEFGAILVRSIEASCRELGYQVVLCLTYESQKLEEEAIAKLLALGVCGLIVLPVHGEFYNSIILKLVLDKFPLVFVDRRLRGLEASTVSSDNMAAAMAATNYLIDAGHRVIAFISRHIANTSTLEERLEGFFRSHVVAGVSIDKDRQVLELPVTFSLDLEGVGEGDTDAELLSIRALLEANPDISAIFAAEYTLAVVARRAMRELGKELEIVCFDEPYRPRYLPEDSLNCIKQPEVLMGREAVRIVHEHQLGVKSEIEVIKLQASLILAKELHS